MARCVLARFPALVRFPNVRQDCSVWAVVCELSSPCEDQNGRLQDMMLQKSLSESFVVLLEEAFEQVPLELLDALSHLSPKASLTVDDVLGSRFCASAPGCTCSLHARKIENGQRVSVEGQQQTGDTS
eukprot:4683850-Amphidinium_carterae.1